MSQGMKTPADDGSGSHFFNSSSSPVHLIILASFVALIVPLSALLLAAVAAIRNRRVRRDWNDYRTSLYSGRVSHVRFRPTKHSFSYPLFFCLLDLSEIDDLFGGVGANSGDDDDGNAGNSSKKANGRGALWPLSLLMQFREVDHLKNGEGLGSSISGSGSSPPTNSGSIDRDAASAPASEPSSVNPDSGRAISPSRSEAMLDRVRRLVWERTGGKCRIEDDQPILLLTHLSYFGYCFNPVSFCYVLRRRNEAERKDGDSANGGASNRREEGDEEEEDEEMFRGWEIEALVGEVSNTPWNEMHCYVLHPDSVDVTRVTTATVDNRRRNDKDKKDGSSPSSEGEGRDEIDSDFSLTSHSTSTNYVFPKQFHVSPFMAMDHTYDWTFHWTDSPPIGDEHTIEVSTDMVHTHTSEKYFNAHFRLRRQPFTPFALWYQIVRLPIYCALIQLWIHWEALLLFVVKGVEFVPHPMGTETRASRWIGTAMAPMFAAKDWLAGAASNNKVNKVEKVE